MFDLNEITGKVVSGDAASVVDFIKTAIDKGINPNEILNKGLIPGMAVVGEKMNTGDMFIPEVLRSARAFDAGIHELKPELGKGDIHSSGKVVIGTVKGDLHDIGKNLVVMMLECNGFDVVNLGVNISPEAFVQAVGKENPDIVAISALLTTTMPMMQQTIDAILESRLHEKINIIVGGAPLTEEFAVQIGADGYAPDAGSAARMAKELVSKSLTD